jgi:P-type conjugative transfer protein TrbJ
MLINKRVLSVTVLFVWVFFAMTTGAYGGGGGITGGAMEFTQVANNSELILAVKKATEQVHNQITQITNQITQITNQIKMVQDMVMNTLSLPSQIFGEVMGVVNRVKRVYEDTRGVIFSLGNIDGMFRKNFRSFEDMRKTIKTIKDYDAEYAKISEARQETITTVMKAIGVKYDQYTSDAELLTQLQKKAESAEGRNQILQAANQLNSFTARQLMDLKELSMLQINAYSSVVEAERARDDLERTKVLNSRRRDVVEKYKKLTF